VTQAESLTTTRAATWHQPHTTMMRTVRSHPELTELAAEGGNPREDEGGGNDGNVGDLEGEEEDADNNLHVHSESDPVHRRLTTALDLTHTASSSDGSGGVGVSVSERKVPEHAPVSTTGSGGGELGLDTPAPNASVPVQRLSRADPALLSQSSAVLSGVPTGFGGGADGEKDSARPDSPAKPAAAGGLQSSGGDAVFEAELRQAHNARFSFLPYLREELSGHEVPERDYSFEREAVYNFVQVPFQLERLLFFGVLVCVDSFLFLVTFLPLRLFVTGCKITLGLLSLLVSVLTLGFVRPLSYTRWRQFCEVSPAQYWDVVRALIMFIAIAVLMRIDTSRVYHYIRGQAVIKLYVIYNVLEILDKLCCSFGHDIYDALLSVIVRSAPDDKSAKSIAMHPISLSVLALIYTVVHGIVLFATLVTLNVAINSHNGLLTLLVRYVCALPSHFSRANIVTVHLLQQPVRGTERRSLQEIRGCQFVPDLV
jgi:phage-related holin